MLIDFLRWHPVRHHSWWLENCLRSSVPLEGARLASKSRESNFPSQAAFILTLDATCSTLGGARRHLDARSSTEGGTSCSRGRKGRRTRDQEGEQWRHNGVRTGTADRGGGSRNGVIKSGILV